MKVCFVYGLLKVKNFDITHNGKYIPNIKASSYDRSNSFIETISIEVKKKIKLLPYQHIFLKEFLYLHCFEISSQSFEH